LIYYFNSVVLLQELKLITNYKFEMIERSNSDEEENLKSQQA